jgi:hypothetical protein
MTSVHEYGELYRPWPADVRERVERGPDRPAGEQDVIDQDNRAAVDAINRDVGRLERADPAQPQVVAVHRHVQSAARDLDTFDVGDPGRDPARQGDAAGRDAEDHDVGRAVTALDDLV